MDRDRNRDREARSRGRFDDGEVVRYGAGESWRPLPPRDRNRSPPPPAQLGPPISRRARSPPPASGTLSAAGPGSGPGPGPPPPGRDRLARSPPPLRRRSPHPASAGVDSYMPGRSPRRRSRSPDRFRRDVRERSRDRGAGGPRGGGPPGGGGNASSSGIENRPGVSGGCGGGGGGGGGDLWRRRERSLSPGRRDSLPPPLPRWERDLIRDPRDQSYRDVRDGRPGPREVIRDVGDRDARDIRDVRDPRDPRDVRDGRDIQDSRVRIDRMERDRLERLERMERMGREWGGGGDRDERFQPDRGPDRMAARPPPIDRFEPPRGRGWGRGGMDSYRGMDEPRRRSRSPPIAPRGGPRDWSPVARSPAHSSIRNSMRRFRSRSPARRADSWRSQPGRRSPGSGPGRDIMGSRPASGRTSPLPPLSARSIRTPSLPESGEHTPVRSATLGSFAIREARPRGSVDATKAPTSAQPSGRSTGLASPVSTAAAQPTPGGVSTPSATVEAAAPATATTTTNTKTNQVPSSEPASAANSIPVADPVSTAAKSSPREPLAQRPPPTGPALDSRNKSTGGASSTTNLSSRPDGSSSTVPPAGPRGYVPARGSGFGRGRGGWAQPGPPRPAAAQIPARPSAANTIPRGPRGSQSLSASASVSASSSVNQANARPFNPPTGPAAQHLNSTSTNGVGNGVNSRPLHAVNNKTSNNTNATDTTPTSNHNPRLSTSTSTSHLPPPPPNPLASLGLPPLLPGGKIEPALLPLTHGTSPDTEAAIQALRHAETGIRAVLAVGYNHLYVLENHWNRASREARAAALRNDLVEAALADWNDDAF